MKTSTRSTLRKVWKREFDRREITWCELQLDGCWRIVQGFAHAKKSDELLPEEFNKVVAACNSCHRQLDEGKSHQVMEDIIDLVIESSDWPTRTEDLNRITSVWKKYQKKSPIRKFQ
jgi:hypothetical protein